MSPSCCATSERLAQISAEVGLRPALAQHVDNFSASAGRQDRTACWRLWQQQQAQIVLRSLTSLGHARTARPQVNYALLHHRLCLLSPITCAGMQGFSNINHDTTFLSLRSAQMFFGVCQHRGMHAQRALR